MSSPEQFSAYFLIPINNDYITQDYFKNNDSLDEQMLAMSKYVKILFNKCLLLICMVKCVFL